jgi:hypothetical protein
MGNKIQEDIKNKLVQKLVKTFRVKIALVTEFFFCLNVHLATLLKPRILRWLLDF